MTPRDFILTVSVIAFIVGVAITIFLSIVGGAVLGVVALVGIFGALYVEPGSPQD